MSAHPPPSFEAGSFLRAIGLIFLERTVFIASSKTNLRPYWVRALHSTYLQFIGSTVFDAFYLLIGASLVPLFRKANSSL